MKNKTVCLRIITKMFEFYNIETTKAMREGYFEELKDEEIENLEKMEKYFIRNSSFMPKLSEILAYIAKLKLGYKLYSYSNDYILEIENERTDDLMDIAEVLKDFLKKIK